ncbi:hypothetical protein [Streptomyces sp. NBC_01353]|uniref:hypothetical protein n=1 Tax=Streptomyces sp. NBC_01353 TaxID=2903835 RepID=UPI002E3151E8|nr:hypothetical protein [Streptomyces sp. NBC_01353]
MTARAGRGRPEKFTAEVQKRFLAEVAAGARLGEAAATVDVHRNVPRFHARTNKDFAAALADAQAQGRQARIDDLPHDESRYNNYDCRCLDCTAMATKARAGRRAEADAQEPDGTAELPAAAPQSPTSFLLPRPSSWTAQQAA